MLVFCYWLDCKYAWNFTSVSRTLGDIRQNVVTDADSRVIDEFGRKIYRYRRWNGFRLWIPNNKPKIATFMDSNACRQIIKDQSDLSRAVKSRWLGTRPKQKKKEVWRWSDDLNRFEVNIIVEMSPNHSKLVGIHSNSWKHTQSRFWYWQLC